MQYDLKDSDLDIKYFRARVPQGKELQKRSKRMENNIRLQLALTTTQIATELNPILRTEIVRHGGEITIGAAPRGVLEVNSQALLNKLEQSSTKWVEGACSSSCSATGSGN
eukprot:4904355-Pyramimonas_sp.AAC.1